MGRLIDIEDIVICGWYMEDDDGETYIKLSDVEKCIDKAPTAYDVEAVVAELEEELKHHAKHELRCEEKGYEAGADRHRQKVIAYDTAIGIVKRGGRNE